MRRGLDEQSAQRIAHALARRGVRRFSRFRRVLGWQARREKRWIQVCCLFVSWRVARERRLGLKKMPNRLCGLAVDGTSRALPQCRNARPVKRRRP